MHTEGLDERIRLALTATREIEPPAELDRRVRARLRARRPVGPSLLRPGLATGVAIASLLALLGFLATSLAGAGAAETGPAIAVLGVSLYLMLSTAATLPLLLLALPRYRTKPEELRP